MRRASSERMLAANPMRQQESIDKMAEARRSKGHWKPPIRGGNGTGMTVPQSLLLGALGAGWVVEHAIPTRSKDQTIPHCYKVDLALPEVMLAVEVDGNTHKTKLGRERDAKKDRVLSGLGWTVLRFSNREIASGTSACAQEVLSTISMLRARRPT